MDGINFLTAVRAQSPDTVVMMLTGHADVETATKAVNEGRIFRFLSKPCPTELIARSLEAGLQQYRLVTAERELLQRTLVGSVEVLAEILSLVNPSAFSRAMRLRNYVRRMTTALCLRRSWEYEMAALLSMIGCVTLPSETTDKLATGTGLSPEEQKMVQAHPGVAGKLLSRIPRLEAVGHMIERQYAPIDPSCDADPANADGAIALGGQMLRLLSDFDTLLARGMTGDQALLRLEKRPGGYSTRLLGALKAAVISEANDQPRRTVKEIRARQLLVGMCPLEDIVAENGAMLVPKGQEITETLIIRLGNFAHGMSIREPFRVSCPVRMAG